MVSPPSDLVAQLKRFELFRAVPESDLAWLVAHGEFLQYDNRSLVFKPGEPVDHMLVVLQGRLELLRTQQGQTVEKVELNAGQLAGLLPYSRIKAASLPGYANGDLAVLALHRSHFHEMICDHYALTEVLVHALSDRIRAFTQRTVQNEKMMALGKLSAGLAHELNNPAAAIQRSIEEIKERFSVIPENFRLAAEQGLTVKEIELANKFIAEKMAQPGVCTLSPIQRGSYEDEIADWLEDHGVEDGYALAPTFVEASLKPEDFEQFGELVAPERMDISMRWFESVLAHDRLFEEVREASKRISDLVQSIKAYSHMDRGAERTPADLHEGLRTTLRMLEHKLKRKNIRYEEGFQDDIPKVPVFVSELNQVWTNLIDNAIDAMEPGGTLTLATRLDGDFVKVDVCDTGNGIAPDVLPHIFDPFFTTKAVGEGTGLGLDISRRVVETQHGGRISVESEPGRTRFEVCLPLNP